MSNNLYYLTHVTHILETHYCKWNIFLKYLYIFCLLLDGTEEYYGVYIFNHI